MVHKRPDGKGVVFGKEFSAYDFTWSAERRPTVCVNPAESGYGSCPYLTCLVFSYLACYPLGTKKHRCQGSGRLNKLWKYQNAHENRTADHMMRIRVIDLDGSDKSDCDRQCSLAQDRSNFLR